MLVFWRGGGTAIFCFKKSPLKKIAFFYEKFVRCVGQLAAPLNTPLSVTSKIFNWKIKLWCLENVNIRAYLLLALSIVIHGERTALQRSLFKNQ